REEWDNVSGEQVSAIPVNTTPTSTSQLTLFEAPSNIGDNYGARIRGYLCPPQTGNYTFWIAGDNGAELWLSTDDNPANKVLIASAPGNGFTSPREWTKYSTQQSATVYLKAGQRYYIEALHKEGSGGDNVAVKWQLPDGTNEAPIPGTRLSPYGNSNPITFRVDGSPNITSQNNTLINASPQSGSMAINTGTVADLRIYPNPFRDVATVFINPKESGMIRIQVFDVNGKLVQDIFSGRVEAGISKNFKLTSNGLTSGLYIVRMATNSKVFSQKVSLLNK
ncbi:MAG: T9SS type A sorting domain-containing protein, partial [Chitinophagaceae bacterium]|nr:T9SS type A sorting domain-containing protein [Chitinophagaceae bacterium]